MLNQPISYSPGVSLRSTEPFIATWDFLNLWCLCSNGYWKHCSLGSVIISSSHVLCLWISRFLHSLPILLLMRILSGCSSLREGHTSPLPLYIPWATPTAHAQTFQSPTQSTLEHLYPELHSPMTHSYGICCLGLGSPDRLLK